jgi:hypothetical protein
MLALPEKLIDATPIKRSRACVLQRQSGRLRTVIRHRSRQSTAPCWKTCASLGGKNPDAALDYLFGTNKWMNDSKDQIGNVKSKLNGTLKQLGTYNGYNLICKKSIGDNLSLYTFIVRYDRQPLRFSLLFYNPSSQWRLHNFSYDDNMDEELTEAAKADRLKENLDY